MKAQDLRIGNWVEIQGIQLSQVVGQVTRINGKKIGRNLQPIPLTEEWLERFGFEYSDLNGDSGLWKIPPFQIYGKCNQFIYEYALDVNYVHQLQNLYFALTGEELNQNKEDDH